MKKTFKILGIIAFVLFTMFCIVLTFFNVSHIYYKVYGPSMSPTLNEGVTISLECKDAVLVSKIKSYTRGDIIVIDKLEKDEQGNEKYVIKRLIAEGGDKITIRKIEGYYRIIIVKYDSTGETIVSEPYIDDYSINENLYNKFNSMVLNMGDKYDGEYLTIAEDEVFYLGDNRANSLDCSVYGPTKRENVVGKVDYIVYGDQNMYFQVLKQVFGW